MILMSSLSLAYFCQIWIQQGVKGGCSFSISSTSWSAWSLTDDAAASGLALAPLSMCMYAPLYTVCYSVLNPYFYFSSYPSFILAPGAINFFKPNSMF